MGIFHILYPHTFRDTLAHLGQKICKSPEEFKAWSQNVGHGNVLTTFLSYGEVASDRQGDMLSNLSINHEGENINALDTRALAVAIVQEMNYKKY